MSYLISIDGKKNIVLRPACIQLYPELATLDELELVFLVKAFDYHYKPLRRYNEMDRVRRAMLDTWGDNKPRLIEDIESKDPSRRINICINAYKALQYNPKIEQAEAYQRKINELQEKLADADGPTEIKNILSSQELLRKQISSLENEILEDVISEGQLKGDQELSYLEVLQRNPKLYKAVQERKPKTA